VVAYAEGKRKSVRGIFTHYSKLLTREVEERRDAWRLNNYKGSSVSIYTDSKKALLESSK
jgi:hypothetical protein